jgi:hypothetical protein
VTSYAHCSDRRAEATPRPSSTPGVTGHQLPCSHSGLPEPIGSPLRDLVVVLGVSGLLAVRLPLRSDTPTPRLDDPTSCSRTPLPYLTPHPAWRKDPHLATHPPPRGRPPPATAATCLPVPARRPRARCPRAARARAPSRPRPRRLPRSCLLARLDERGASLIVSCSVVAASGLARLPRRRQISGVGCAQRV